MADEDHDNCDDVVCNCLCSLDDLNCPCNEQDAFAITMRKYDQFPD